MTDRLRLTYRGFLKDSVRKAVDFSTTDQNRGISPPPVQKPYTADAERCALSCIEELQHFFDISLASAVAARRSVRSYSEQAITLKELSFLLWATQGVRENVGDKYTFRTVPSAGARHALETYLFVRLIDGLKPGVYRYLPLEHELVFEFVEEHLPLKLAAACLGQPFAGHAAVTFAWSVIPYRMEWRYAEASYKVIALDAGHVCQNLYLACEAIGAGTCAIAAYDQERLDKLLRLDGEDEFSLYLAPVGKKV